MRFMKGEDVWYLIDEQACADANVIAVLRDEVEILALREFTERFLTGARHAGDAWTFKQGAISYEVVPFSDRGGRLSLRIQGDDGSLRRIESEFAFPGETR